MKDKDVMDLRPADISTEEWVKLLNIWLIYLTIADTTCAERTGYLIDGVRKPISEYLFKERSESVSEHSHKFGVLWGAILATFPDIVFAGAVKANADPPLAQLDCEVLSSVSLLFTLIHDAPEGDPKGPGDVPDNGCDEHGTAKLFERASMSKLLNLFPGYYKGGLMNFYDLFESYGLYSNGKCSGLTAQIAQICKLCDKLEAIYSLLRDERRFLWGHIGRTEEYDNAVDFKRAAYLKVNNPTDVWMFGLRKLMAEYHVEPRFEQLIMRLAMVAFIDTRKEIPYCMTADLDGCE